MWGKKLRFKKLGTDLLFQTIKDLVPLALMRFTSLFEMGRGGTTLLKAPKFLKRSLRLLEVSCQKTTYF